MHTKAQTETLCAHHGIEKIFAKYPTQASSLAQTLLDLTHASKWDHLHLLDLDDHLPVDTKRLSSSTTSASLRVGMSAICGLRPESKGLEIVWSCDVSDIACTELFSNIFSAIDRLPERMEGDESTPPRPLLRDHFLMAVLSPDATVVYYTIARGLVKPVN